MPTSMDAIWKTWPEIHHLCQSKRIILFGCALDWVARTVARLPHEPDFMVDSNPSYDGTTFQGLEVRHADTLKKEPAEEIYVVITGSVYESIAPQLQGYGFTPGRHFCATPEFSDIRLLREMREYDRSVLMASPDYDDPLSKRHSQAGGGLFVYDVGSHDLRKVVPGHFRQLLKRGDLIYAVEFVEMQLYVLTGDFDVADKFPLGKPNTCGLEYCPKRNVLFLADASRDVITVHDPETFKVLDEVAFSDKYRRMGSGQHHINDLCVVEDSLYVSYFSLSGNWKRGIYDGGISEYDIDDLSKPPSVFVSDLWMPHSVKFLDGSLCWLDSMRGRFYTNNQTLGGEFPGFVRGLAYDGRFYYIGQSEDMYLSRLSGITKNRMMNAGFYMFDMETKASRFHSFMDNMNIHDLMIL